MLEITHEYKTVDCASPERLAVIASCRGYQRLQQYYEYPDRNFEDVCFDLMDIDLVPYGQPFDCTMNIQVYFIRIWLLTFVKTFVLRFLKIPHSYFHTHKS